MNRRYAYIYIAVVAGAAAVVALYVALPQRSVSLDEAVPMGRAPRIRPDYGGVTLPANIAPLNFLVQEPGDEFAATFRSARGEPFQVISEDAAIVIPRGSWRRLLEANRGEDLVIQIGVKAHDGRWTVFSPLACRIAHEPIDPYLVYRLMKPIHNKYANLGIYQRHLEGYGESVVVKNTQFDRGCVNCHTFCVNDASRMLLQIRSTYGACMLVAHDGQVVRVNTKTALSKSAAAYSSWHPSGRLIAFSLNTLSQFFHTVGENRDVFDADSDLGVYLLDSNTVTTCDAICQPDRNETWPAWSADGRHLYFSAAPKMPKARYRDIRYDLMRIGYDPDSGKWTTLETLVAAKASGRSALEPRPSPDGRWLLFCMSDYGNFPIYQPSCDLYLMDLATGTYRPLECNSARCDSYHSWSSNSRWIVFSSKRRDGIFARPFFSHIDADGKSHKPFVLPQRDPRLYESLVKTYNAPELTAGPVPVSRRDWGRLVCDPGPDESLKAALDPAVTPRRPVETPDAEPPWKRAGQPAPNQPPGTRTHRGG